MKPEFDEEEINWPKVLPGTSKTTLIKMKGMFRVRDIKHILDIETKELTKLKRKCQKDNVDMYTKYGVKKVGGSQYVVKMSLFSPYYIQHLAQEPLDGIRAEIQKLPENIQNINDLFQLTGLFKFSDISHMAPLSHFVDAIKKKIKDVKMDQGNHCGIWFDRFTKEYLVEMETFRKWFVEHMWNSDED
jgi:hypothetical protein